MNNKYFGNSLDLFKYDLITFLTKEENSELFYVPMLTEPEEKKLDPKYNLYEVGAKNKILLNYMLKVNNPVNNYEFLEIENYFKDISITSNIVKNLNKEYFNDNTRNKYFKNAVELYKKRKQKNLFFIDPCVGLTISIKRRVRSNKKLYLNTNELELILNNLKKGDFICYFQHLGNHNYKMEDRIYDLKQQFDNYVLIAGYKRILASLVFIFKSEDDYIKTKRKIKTYFKQYENLNDYHKIILL